MAGEAQEFSCHVSGFGWAVLIMRDVVIMIDHRVTFPFVKMS
jgi:hypothetical protein